MRLPIAAACALAALILPLPALAGNLSLSSSATPATGVTLGGSDQTATYTIPSTVADGEAPASSLGWNLTITSTTFTSGSHALPQTASVVAAAPAYSCTGGSGSCTDPVNGVAYPVAVPAGAAPPAPVEIFNAAPTSGTGTYALTPVVTISVPANAYSGAYTSTVTLAIVSGP